MRKILLTLLALAASLEADTIIMPSFATVPQGWFTDRYDPHSFTDVGDFQGRDNVLQIGISSAEGALSRPTGYGGSFYNTQGRGYNLSGGPGAMLAADLFVPNSWADPANGNVRTDLWGVMTDGTTVSGYPIIGFTNYGQGGARLRIWDDTNTVWIDLPTLINYDTWTRLGIGFTGMSYEFSVNGSVVYTDSQVNGSIGFKEAIMQAYNFYDPSLTGANPVDYTADWADAPEPGTWTLVLGSGLIGAIVLRGRARE